VLDTLISGRWTYEKKNVRIIHRAKYSCKSHVTFFFANFAIY
jgi:hypothetical protein